MKRTIYLFISLLFMLILTSCKKNSPYIRENNKIYFGSYPSSLESNETIINKLNKKIDNLPTETNNYNWINYNYYILDEVKNYMWYIDISLDNEKYRGIYFIKYRPHYTHLTDDDTYSVQLKNNYLIDNVYWFKFEKIEWDILEEKSGKLKLISNKLIDSQDFYPSSSRALVEHNGGNGYTNNYELSNIRKFLNDSFYNIAFNDKEKKLINDMNVCNSNKEVGSIYISNDTIDKVTLLSFEEVKEYYSEPTNRIFSGTDYAKAQGLNYIKDSGYWLLRSPYSSNPNYMLLVNLSGNIIHAEVNSTFTGIKPVITINL